MPAGLVDALCHWITHSLLRQQDCAHQATVLVFCPVSAEKAGLKLALNWCWPRDALVSCLTTNVVGDVCAALLEGLVFPAASGF